MQDSQSALLITAFKWAVWGMKYDACWPKSSVSCQTWIVCVHSGYCFRVLVSERNMSSTNHQNAGLKFHRQILPCYYACMFTDRPTQTLPSSALMSMVYRACTLSCVALRSCRLPVSNRQAVFICRCMVQLGGCELTKSLVSRPAVACV